MAKKFFKNCLICNRISKIIDNSNPYFVAELETGYVVIGDHQYFKGYTLFLCKQHKEELHELSPAFRLKFLKEMAEVAEAVFIAFNPEKLNYELLGNTEKHLHWHIFPRHKDDLLPKVPIWCIDKDIRCSEEFKPTLKDLIKTKKILLKALKKTTKYLDR